MTRALLLSVAVWVAACGSDERAPAHAVDPDAGQPDAAADAGSVDGGPKIRSVEHRNPFGDTARDDNTMVDGDFEWTSGFGQHGWRSLGPSGETALLRETGGLCRSGVTCGVLEAQSSLSGMAASPKAAEMLITVHSKPPEPDCGLTAISVISCTSAVVLNLATVPPEESVPDADGWCAHSAVTESIEDQPCLYITSFAQGSARILIDQVSIVPAPTTGSSASRLAPDVPTASRVQRVRRDLRWIAEHQVFGRVRPSGP